MNNIEEALAYAKEKHKGQMRANGKPYFIHCLEVYKIVKNFTSDKDVLLSAILHDTIEDTEVTFKDLENKFGIRVAKLVREVSKDEYGNFSNLYSREAKLIKLCDRIQNVSDVDSWLEKNCYRYLGDTRVLLLEHYLIGED